MQRRTAIAPPGFFTGRPRHSGARALDRSTATAAKRAALVAYFRDVPPEDAAWGPWLLAGGKLARIANTTALRDRIVAEADSRNGWWTNATRTARRWRCCRTIRQTPTRRVCRIGSDGAGCPWPAPKRSGGAKR